MDLSRVEARVAEHDRHSAEGEGLGAARDDEEPQGHRRVDACTHRGELRSGDGSTGEGCEPFCSGAVA